MVKLYILLMGLTVLIGIYSLSIVVSQADQRAHAREKARLVYLDKMGINR